MNKTKQSQPRLRRLKTAVANYRMKVRELKKQLLVAAKNYKQAVDKERMEVARRRLS